MKPYYEDGSVTIYHGDAREVLPMLGPQSVDLLLTDPPYGMAYESLSGQAAIAGDGTREGVRIVRQVMFEARPILAKDAHVLVFCHWQSWPDFYDSLCGYFPIRGALIWHKGGGGMGNVRANYIRDYEVILYGALGTREIGGLGSYSSVIQIPKPNGVGRLHPTQKPETLFGHLIERHAPVGGVVLDPFLGSGSSLVVARNRGRRAIGIELEERYCEIAVKRLAQEVLPLWGKTAGEVG